MAEFCSYLTKVVEYHEYLQYIKIIFSLSQIMGVDFIESQMVIRLDESGTDVFHACDSL